MNEGWIKVHRKMLQNPVVMKDADHLAVWVYLLLNATHDKWKTIFGGKKITLKPGQLIVGRKKIASELHISPSKVYRVLNAFKSEHQIEQRTTPHGTLITICSWLEYQQGEQPNGQQMNNKWTTSEQQVNTIQECKEGNNGENIYIFAPPTVDEVRAYCIERGNGVDPEKFIDFYEMKDWMVGKNKMKNWKAAVRNWERNGASKPSREKKGRLDWLDEI